MRDQVAQKAFALIGAAIGEIDLRQRQLGQRRILGVPAVRHFLVEFFGFSQFALVGMNRPQIILRDLAFGSVQGIGLRTSEKAFSAASSFRSCVGKLTF